ncbi:MAG: acyl-CoA thioesterase [Alphaproteobacteria bacterium]|jgi:acyl-CoA thioester hydrolase|nr:acyl-CoA thioesterase [Alphaproteobacteria bacterium]
MTINIEEICTFSVDITYQDTDIAGVVYFANYLNYAERGRSKLLKSLFGKIKFEGEQNWAVRSTSINYFLPTKIDDTLVVKTSIKELKKASLVFLHEMFVGENLVAVNEIHLLSIGADLRPTRISNEIYEKLLEIYNTTERN